MHTVEDFERFLADDANSECLYELIDGAIIEKLGYTDECSFIAGLLLYWLSQYAIMQGLGLPGPSRSFRLPDNDYQVRTPNISMIVDPSIPLSTERVMAYIPDVVAEIKMPDDSIDELREKAKFYISSGVRLVWLVFPRQKIVEVYRPEQPSEMLTGSDTLDGYDVLPGFSLPIANLFATTQSG
jgi:Uma2 family endonuclease